MSRPPRPRLFTRFPLPAAVLLRIAQTTAIDNERFQACVKKMREWNTRPSPWNAYPV